MVDWIACNFVKGLSWLLCRLPPAISVWLGERLGLLTYWFQPKRRRIGVINLRAAFHGQLTTAQAHRIIRDCCQQLGAGIAEMLRLPVMDRAYMDRYVSVEGRRHFDEAVASHRPIMFLTGHYGNWELASIMAALNGYPIVALARAQDKFPKLYALLVSYRESKGCTIVHKGNAMRRLITALDQRQMVGIVGDQASRQGILVDFFGRPALFAKGPFELAYEKEALLLPVFMHRVRGPFHRAVVECPITMPRDLPRADAVRAGITQFAERLARHIQESPHQWLWMHKRWKHTPARRVLVLSDGKLGHLKQSLAVVEAMRAHQFEIRHEVIEVRYRHRLARALTLVWSAWRPCHAGAVRCLQWALTPDAAAALLRRHADLIVSCGASTAPVNLLWAAENGAKSIVVMNPAPLALRRFDLVIAPRHDQLPQRANVVQTLGAIVGRMSEASLRQARARLAAHPNFRAGPSRHSPGPPLAIAGAGAATSMVAASGAEASQHPAIAVFIGGDTPHHDLHPAFIETLIGHVTTVCDANDGWCLVTTSRRTSPAVERWLTDRLRQHPRCRLLLIATRDQLDGTIEGMLGSADVAVVTGESISMVSEAAASGRRVVIVPPPLRDGHAAIPAKLQRFFQDLPQGEQIRIAAVSELRHAVQRALKDYPSAAQVDTFTVIHDAVGRLL